MKLNGGIAIIGSLVWDNSLKRKSWRNKYFDQDNRISIKLPIRYGRISSSRMNTYTMTYSANLSLEEYGQAVLLRFQNTINEISNLRDILENTIRVERDKSKEEWKFMKKGEAFTLNWNWGVVGISINPKHFSKDGKANDIIQPILEYWKDNLSDFQPKTFSIKHEEQFIDKNGRFFIDWKNDFDDLDFVITTLTQPKTEHNNTNYPSAKEIAKSMYTGNYYSYFIKNVENGIRTKDDEIILQLIKSEYGISNYIENLLQKGK